MNEVQQSVAQEEIHQPVEHSLNVFSELRALIKFNSKRESEQRNGDLLDLGVAQELIDHYSPVGQELLKRRIQAGSRVPRIIGKASLKGNL